LPFPVEHFEEQSDNLETLKARAIRIRDQICYPVACTCEIILASMEPLITIIRANRDSNRKRGRFLDRIGPLMKIGVALIKASMPYKIFLAFV